MRAENKTHKIRKELLKNIRKQREEYPDITKKVLDKSDIIVEVLDARFYEDMRNKEFEKLIKSKNRKLIYVLNKSDLADPEKLKKVKLYPNVKVSCKERKGIKKLRDRIKIESKRIKKPQDKLGNITVGIIGYPNTGKSSLINLLIGKTSAPASSQAGFTKAMQKIKLSEGIFLLDSPGVIPIREYSSSDKEKITKHTKVGGRHYTQIKEPDIVVANLMKDYTKEIESHYKIDSEGDPEVLLEKLGRKKGFLKKGNEVDENKTAKLVLKDFQEGDIKV